MTSMVFVVPVGLSRPTGGNRYDQELTRALSDLGTSVEVREVAGDWPEADGPARAALAAALRSEAPVLADGLLACGAPQQVADAVAAGGRVHVLVHMPLALDIGLTPQVAARRDALERASLRAATSVLTISAWTAAELRRRHGLARVAVARPGAGPAPLAHGSDPPRLLHLAAVTPVKDQLGVVTTLAQLRDLPWTAWLSGDDRAAPGYAATVREAIRTHRLNDRVLLTGPLTGDELHAAFAATDLLLLPSRAETWGLAVTEALARGIPAVVSAGTGAVEALTGGEPCDPRELPGAVVPPGDRCALAAALRAQLAADRVRARTAARARRSPLPSWQDTARTVLEAVPEAVLGGGRISPAPQQYRAAIPARPVDPDWLALREDADARARALGSTDLLRQLVQHLRDERPSRGDGPLRVVDLGWGTGANPRWLAPRLAPPGRQRWTTVDHDQALTVTAPVLTTAVLADVADLEAVLARLGGADLVTAAALLDLLDEPRLTAVIDAVVGCGAAALFSLTVDGQVRIDPPDPYDDALAHAFDAHQRREGRVDPDAGAAAAGRFRAHGWRVVEARTPWRLSSDVALIEAWLSGRAEAAAEWEPDAADQVAAWLERRRRRLGDGGLEVLVGHLDVLALPPPSRSGPSR
jgi:glycosyltransferase involved in cell wall biosynthesis